MSKYLVVGTKSIEEDYFKNISISLNNYSFKPRGGLWACDISNSLSEFLDFLKSKNKFDFEIIKSTPYCKGCLITLKKDSKIYYIKNEEDIFKLSTMYPSLFHESIFFDKGLLKDKYPIDYRKMSIDYDGFFVDPFVLPKKYYLSDVNNMGEFGEYDCNSLVLFNSNPIDFYNPIDIIESKGNLVIEKEYEKEYVKPVNIYNDLYLEVKDVFDREVVNILTNDLEEYLVLISRIGFNVRKLYENLIEFKILNVIIHNITADYVNNINFENVKVKSKTPRVYF